MEFEDLPATAAEQFNRHCQLQVLVSRRIQLNTDGWSLDLCSPFWRIYVNHRSGAYLEHAGRRRELRGRALWLIPAWVRFQTGLQGAVTQDYIHFHLSGLPVVMQQRFFSEPRELSSTAVPSAFVQEWRKGFGSSADFSHLHWAAALAHAAIASGLAEWNAADPGGYLRWLAESSDFQPALLHLAAHPATPPTNRELSRLCGISEDHFIRRFRLLVGQTPAEYGRERRIALAAEWLTGSRRTLDDIAEATGFTDRFHFSRVFKQRLGLPPAAYRRMHRREV